MAKISRRDILKIFTQAALGISGLVGLAGLLRFLSFQPDPPPPQQFEVGLVKDYLIDTRTIIKSIPAVLIRTNQGFKALSLTCQHLGCTVDSRADGFLCPCHGSQYGYAGELITGPAEKGLKTLQVEITADEHVIILKG